MKVTNRKLHKISGLIAGVFLSILAITGFFLDHDSWRFLHNTTFSNVPQSTIKLQNKSYESYWIDPLKKNHIIVGGKRGLFESFDSGDNYVKIFDATIYAIREYKDILYIATERGIYQKKFNDSQLELFLLDKSLINSMNIYQHFLVAAIDKSTIILYDLLTKNKQIFTDIQIDSTLLNQDITLSRFVRDLHYGRGLFDGSLSLYINDFAAIVLTLLAISGFLLWLYIAKIKQNHKYKQKIKLWVKIHSNFIMLIALLPLLFLIVTGIFLDHSSSLRNFMKTTIVSNKVLPPVYHTLKSDIWGVDFDGKYFYIGNRYGLFQTKYFKKWKLLSKGFAYRLIRKNQILYISGMGAKNRVFKDNKVTILPKTPHMFKDVVFFDHTVHYFATCERCATIFKIPHFKDATLYDVLLSLHDGTFFSKWWIWINDFVSILLIVLGITGFIRWKKRK